MNSGAAMACAVAGAATMLNGHCAAQPYVAADYATNSIYNSGWSAGQNGGYGFGAWSFNATDPSGAPSQSMSTASALGTAWTLFTTNLPDPPPNQNHIGGLANAGRAILEPGGLQVGQTFQTIIQNPVNNAGIYTYRGFDMLFTSATDNNPGGDNTAALRIQVFDYYNPAMHWHINDAGDVVTNLSAMTTGASGMIVALTLDSTNTYTLNMAPVSNPNSPYLTYSGTLGTNLPINYFNFRNYNNPNPSGDTNDVADNFQISSMTIRGTMLNIQSAGANTVLSWSTNVPGFVLASSPTLNPGAVWNTNLPAPTVIGNQNFVTNPISGPQQFYRLQLVQ
jgi:hypothetical protein